MRLGRTCAAASAIALTLGAFGQTPGAPVFEVASIRLVTPNQNDRFALDFSAASGRLTARNASLYILVLRAYDLRDFQLSGGPDWLKTDLYNIEAKAAGRASEAELKQMLQALLADRMQLKVHRETKEIPMYALAVGKSGVKMQTAKEESGRPSMAVGRGQLTAHNATTAMLVSALSRLIGTPVEDASGLSGHYDFMSQYDAAQLSGMYAAPAAMPGSLPDVNGPSLFSAVQEQLGLKLELRKVAKDALVIDSVRRPGEN